ncbi:MAG: hypothetical protein Q8N91_02380, partial [Candidatus Omnitrophota bacterium]|nr:hypothetical protein [Candidatus Omnitrophota bacterium]
ARKDLRRPTTGGRNRLGARKMPDSFGTRPPQSVGGSASGGSGISAVNLKQGRVVYTWTKDTKNYCNT